jgi:hypothetical protein
MGLKSIANALAGRNLGGESNRALPPKSPNSAGARTTEQATAETPEPEEIEEIEDESIEEVSNGNGNERRRRPAPRAPKFLSDLNLTTASVLLADFVKEKNPENDMDKYAVIAVWFKEYFNTDEISIDHIFTAYRALNWQTQLPSDLSQTFRKLKSKNWFDGGSTRGYYKINWNGVDGVNKMGVVKA